jgi:hypothetical protein
LACGIDREARQCGVQVRRVLRCHGVGKFGSKGVAYADDVGKGCPADAARAEGLDKGMCD